MWWQGSWRNGQKTGIKMPKCCGEIWQAFGRGDPAAQKFSKPRRPQLVQPQDWRVLTQEKIRKHLRNLRGSKNRKGSRDKIAHRPLRLLRIRRAALPNHLGAE